MNIYVQYTIFFKEKFNLCTQNAIIFFILLTLANTQKLLRFEKRGRNDNETNETKTKHIACCH